MSQSVKDLTPFVKHVWLYLSTEQVVVDVQKPTDLETLARMAARLAGRDPDEHVRVAVGEVVAFDGVMWRYPDFLARAEAAYAALAGPLQAPV